MPELPEVETVRKALIKNIKNRTIIDVKILRKNIVEDEPKFFISALKNRTFKDIHRIGKFLIFLFDNDLVMLSHLRMEGKYILGKDKNDISKYARVIFYFKDKSILNYDDSRTFGYMALRNKNNYLKVPPISELGIEAINNINIDKIYPLFHKSHKCIKEVLLDQHIISGLGNIYVDETLFKSKISPLSISSYLSKKDVSTLLKNAREILLKSIKFNGSTIHSFKWDQGKSGRFQSFLKVYGKKGEACPNCKNPFVKIKIGGRGTTYCPYCQRLIKDKYILGITGPISSGKSTALNLFKENGFKTYSCDEEIAKLYLDKDFKKELKKIFKVDSKDKIRKLVSTNKKELAKLNNLIHPLIKKDIVKFIENNKGKIAIEVPLLFQTNFDSLMDETLLILTDKNKDYILNRGNKSKEQLKINNSLDYSIYKNKATYVITNNKSLRDFKNNITKISK